MRRLGEVRLDVVPAAGRIDLVGLRDGAGQVLERSTITPDSPRSQMTSGTAPRRVATTGVPQAIDSSITRPNGSSQSIGNSVQRARCSSRTFSSCETSPRYCDASLRCGATSRGKYSRSSGLVHLAGELERQAHLLRDAIARPAPFCGLIRPMNSR